MGGTGAGAGAITVRVEVGTADGVHDASPLEVKTWLFRAAPSPAPVDRVDEVQCAHAADRKCEFASNTRLLVATAFCLIWNVSTTVVTLALVRTGLKADLAMDSPEMVTLLLTAMPFLIVGSVLMWLVVGAWSKRLGRRYAGGNFCRCRDPDSAHLRSASELSTGGVQLT